MSDENLKKPGQPGKSSPGSQINMDNVKVDKTVINAVRQARN